MLTRRAMLLGSTAAVAAFAAIKATYRHIGDYGAIADAELVEVPCINNTYTLPPGYWRLVAGDVLNNHRPLVLARMTPAELDTAFD